MDIKDQSEDSVFWLRSQIPHIIIRCFPCAFKAASVVSDSLQPIDRSNLSGSSVHGILQGRILVWVAMPSLFSVCFTYFYSFIWLRQVLVMVCRIFSGSMWDQVPWSRIEPRAPILGAQSLSHWTTMEVSSLYVLNKFLQSAMCPLGIPSCDPKFTLWTQSHTEERSSGIESTTSFLQVPPHPQRESYRMMSGWNLHLGPRWPVSFSFLSPLCHLIFQRILWSLLQWRLAYVHSRDISSPADTYRGNIFVRKSYTFSLLIFILYWNIVD